MKVMAAREFKVSAEARSKALRRAILGPEDVTITLSQGQRRALTARRALARLRAADAQR